MVCGIDLHKLAFLLRFFFGFDLSKINVPATLAGRYLLFAGTFYQVWRVFFRTAAGTILFKQGEPFGLCIGLLGLC